MSDYEKELNLQKEKLIELMGVKQEFMQQETKTPSWHQEQICLKYDARINRALYDNR